MPIGDLDSAAVGAPLGYGFRRRSGIKPGTDDITTLARHVERKRRLFARQGHPPRLPRHNCLELTLASFQMEQLTLSPQEALAAVARGVDRRVFRSPHSLRLRNHLAIIQSIGRLTPNSIQLKPPAIIRWYTSISCGLSIAAVNDSQTQRLTQLLQQMQWPIHRLLPAISEIATLHTHLLSDPLFPGFNGIMARLLLQYHLTRCGLPAVLFKPAIDLTLSANPDAFTPRLLELLGQSYDRLSGLSREP